MPTRKLRRNLRQGSARNSFKIASHHRKLKSFTEQDTTTSVAEPSIEDKEQKHYAIPTSNFDFAVHFSSSPTNNDNEDRKAKRVINAYLALTTGRNPEEIPLEGKQPPPRKPLPSGPFPLFKLPLEIRHEIYRQVLIDPKRGRPDRVDIFYEQWCMRGKSWRLRPLQMTCKQLRKETHDYYFSTIRFNVSLNDLFNKQYDFWLPLIDGRGAAAVRKLDFEGIIHASRKFSTSIHNDTSAREFFTTKYRICLRLFSKEPWFSVQRADIATKRRFIGLVTHRSGVEESDEDEVEASEEVQAEEGSKEAIEAAEKSRKKTNEKSERWLMKDVDEQDEAELAPEVKRRYQDYQQQVVQTVLAIREQELSWMVFHMVMNVGIGRFGTKEIKKLLDLAFERRHISIPLRLIEDTALNSNTTPRKFSPGVAASACRKWGIKLLIR